MIGDNIKKIMQLKKIRSKDLAQSVGVTPTHISYILNNRRDPSVELLNNIANALDVSVNAFFQEQPPDPQKIELDNKDKKEITTIAAHHDGDEWTEEELEDIEKFKDFVRMKRQQRKGK